MTGTLALDPAARAWCVSEKSWDPSSQVDSLSAAAPEGVMAAVGLLSGLTALFASTEHQVLEQAGALRVAWNAPAPSDYLFGLASASWRTHQEIGAAKVALEQIAVDISQAKMMAGEAVATAHAGTRWFEPSTRGDAEWLRREHLAAGLSDALLRADVRYRNAVSRVGAVIGGDPSGQLAAVRLLAPGPAGSTDAVAVSVSTPAPADETDPVADASAQQQAAKDKAWQNLADATANAAFEHRDDPGKFAIYLARAKCIEARDLGCLVSAGEYEDLNYWLNSYPGQMVEGVTDAVGPVAEVFVETVVGGCDGSDVVMCLINLTPLGKAAQIGKYVRRVAVPLAKAPQVIRVADVKLTAVVKGAVGTPTRTGGDGIHHPTGHS